MQRCSEMFWDSLHLGMHIAEMKTSCWGHMKTDLVVWGALKSSRGVERAVGSGSQGHNQ